MIASLIFGLVLSSTPPAINTPLRAPQNRSDASKTNFEQLLQQAARAKEESRDDDAIRLYRQALSLRPNWQEGLWSLATLAYQKERYSEARDVLRTFVSQSPQIGPGWALLGLSEFQTREYTRSLDHLQRAMTQGMGERKEMAESVFYTVSVLLTRFERYDDGMSLLIAMVKSGHDEKDLVEPIGLAALRLPLLPAEIPPARRDLIVMAGQATLALESQRQDQAQQLFDKMVATFPDEPSVHFLRGAFLMDVQPEEGVKELQRELQVSPSSVPARLRLAEQFTKQQQYERALPIAREAVKLDPANSRAHMILGEVLAGNGDAPEAIRSLEIARKYSPETVRIHWALLRAYSAVGRTEDAARERETIQNLIKTQR